MDIEKERDKFRCQVCNNRANLIVFYHKYYPAERSSAYEEPALICQMCDEAIRFNNYLGDYDKMPVCYKIVRGGIENIHRLTIDYLTSLTVK